MLSAYCLLRLISEKSINKKEQSWTRYEEASDTVNPHVHQSSVFPIVAPLQGQTHKHHAAKLALYHFGYSTTNKEST